MDRDQTFALPPSIWMDDSGRASTTGTPLSPDSIRLTIWGRGHGAVAELYLTPDAAVTIHAALTDALTAAGRTVEVAA